MKTNLTILEWLILSLVKFWANFTSAKTFWRKCEFCKKTCLPIPMVFTTITYTFKSQFFLGWQTHGHVISRILFKVWEVKDIWSLVKDMVFKISATLSYHGNKPTLVLPIFGSILNKALYNRRKPFFILIRFLDVVLQSQTND